MRSCSRWRDLRALRDPDAWDAWLRRLTVRACYRIAGKERRRTLVELHVMPDPGSRSAPRTSRRMSPSATGSSRSWVAWTSIDGRSSCCTTTSTCPSPRWPTILDIPYGTVASRLHRGLAAMRTDACDAADGIRTGHGAAAMNEHVDVERTVAGVSRMREPWRPPRASMTTSSPALAGPDNVRNGSRSSRSLPCASIPGSQSVRRRCDSPTC